MKSTIIVFIVLSLFAISDLAQSSKAARNKPKIFVPLCKLTEDPKFRGFYLGQTVDEIIKMIPNFREAYERARTDQEQREPQTEGVPLSNWVYIDRGIANEINYVYMSSDNAFGFNSNKKLSIKSLDEDVSFAWFFLKEKLYAYGVYYREFEPEEEQSAQSFIKQLSEKTSIPRTGWTKVWTANIDTPENRRNHVMMNQVEAELRCNGFRIFLNAGYRDSPHLIITDTDVEKEIRQLEKEIMLRQKREEAERIRMERKRRTTFKP